MYIEMYCILLRREDCLAMGREGGEKKSWRQEKLRINSEEDEQAEDK